MILKVILLKIWNLILGHFTVFKHSFKKRVTLEYPDEKAVLSSSFRGQPKWLYEKCISCKICEKVCPSGAINISKNDDNFSCKIDLNKCIICGNCAYYCPKHAVYMSNEYELATTDKSSLNIEINTLNSACENNIIN